MTKRKKKTCPTCGYPTEGSICLSHIDDTYCFKQIKKERDRISRKEKLLHENLGQHVENARKNVTSSDKLLVTLRHYHPERDMHGVDDVPTYVR